MNILKQDYLFWKIVHHYVFTLKWRVLDQRTNEIWLENEGSKPREVIRVIRTDIDWANSLRNNVIQSVKAFERIRQHLSVRELVGKNLFISVYPPVDSWEDIVKPFFINEKQKTKVVTSLLTKEGEGHLDKDDSVLLALDTLQSNEDVEQLEQQIQKLKQEVQTGIRARLENEKNLFLFGKPIATYLLLATVAILFFFLERSGGSTSILTLIEFGAKYNPLIIEGEWWRFFTSMFLHIGFVHLAMNSLALIYLGGAVERMYGTRRFLIIYLIAGLIGSIASFAFNTKVSAGASGAIFGCFGALLYFGTIHPKLFFRTMGKNLFFVLALNLIFGFSVQVVDNGAHIGGLVGGFLASAMLHLPKHTRSYKQFLAAIATAATMAILLFYGWNNDQKTVDPLTELSLGQEYLMAENVDEAYPFLQRAVEIDPTMPEATFLLAYAEAMRGNYQEAHQLLETTITERPDFHEAHYNLALVYLEFNQIEKAREAVSRAMELDSNQQYLDLYNELSNE
ncbi:rhomboid family protein [Bacillus suaedae]|uniref:Rhomboid family intramembrane serine protease n=1 Tax=Halalkalibacter suaedae TaxID=2822140 RepID=A0A940WS03_9BACI|nr:rhomboid family intramembrane serine protease [Bacillus suaedae]MBP3951241.1 rhomboid family intramembrane serine protease [Bacillus suaedae]